MSDSWRTRPTQELLIQRAAVLSKIRGFMQERRILEVETPILSTAGNPEPAIECFTVQLSPEKIGKGFYLNTSPEFCMKRMLASGIGPIYQLGKAFRKEEVGRIHQPEFSILEWYRPGFDYHQLMDEVNALLKVLNLDQAERRTYGEVFLEKTHLDPYTATSEELQQKANEAGLRATALGHAGLLDFLFSHFVSATLGQDKPVFVYDYPVSQAALARLKGSKPEVACRFELFAGGVELANGFYELCDVDEQRERFEQDNQNRRRQGLDTIELDEDFLSALNAGLPECSGVAMGIDRLIMILTGVDSINDVMTFPLTYE